MGALIENYRNISKRVTDLNAKINSAEEAIAKLSNGFAGDTSIRIAKLEEQLIKIDEYLLKVKGFQELAKKNLDSQNVLTIEAPPGYRVNLNRLRNWAMMIDPTSANDPYAQRVYVVAKCDEFFLESKKKEFQDRIHQLRTSQENGTNDEIENLKQSIASYQEDIRQYVIGEEVREFVNYVLKENTKYWNKLSPTSYSNRGAMAPTIAFGAYAAPFPVGTEQREAMKAILGEFYDVKGGRILLPVEMDNTREYVMSVTCTANKRKHLDRALQNLVLNTINAAPAGRRKIFILDAVRFNTSSMSGLRELEGTFALEQIPRNPEQLTATLEQIVSSFADTDEIMELHDSVAEYNASAGAGNQLPLSTMVLFGWPHSYEGRDRELLQRILTNYERYGISIVLVSYRTSEKAESFESLKMPEYAFQNMTRISVTNTGTSITMPSGNPQAFTWYTFNDVLSAEYVSMLSQFKPTVETIGNEYIKRYSLTEIPEYIRAYKKIELPFGIDGKDVAHSVSFENENFATYLVGASRSGKSTLIHTLIAGLIRNYHPDNVELWLADFKQLEFKRYINHLPPHVKYVLLDESTELVFDLIDKLTAEMMERQKLFARLGKQRIDQVDPTTLDKPLPVIFVILDEFSIMSQSIAESPIYKLRLQNILAKGAALGIRFLFSSQTFTTGVAGLTSTARAQIQQRIAMKGTKEEISETLELSANLKTEQVRNWMDALPPHYALVKFRSGADTLPQVKRFYVMYFKDYAPRDAMIKSINDSMRKVEEYCPVDIHTYVDKRPVLVDGNTFEAYQMNQLEQFIGEINIANKNNTQSEDKYLLLGTPRLMVRTKALSLSSETRENVLLIARSSEQACAASINLSAIKSFLAQNGKVQIWAYSKNRLYSSYKNLFNLPGVQVFEGLDAVCNAIVGMKKAIQHKVIENTLVILVGMDRICMDFDYVQEKSSDNTNDLSSIEAKGAVSSEADIAQKDLVDGFSREWAPIQAKLETEGKTHDEIRAIKREHMREYKKRHNYERKTSDENTQKSPAMNEAPISHGGAYNAKTDWEFVVKQGSRLGYHFMLTLNSVNDLKATGLKMDYFRHRMAFQTSVDDSRLLFASKISSTLPEHICQYDDSFERYSFRPYLNEGVEWDGWKVENSSVISPYEMNDE